MSTLTVITLNIALMFNSAGNVCESQVPACAKCTINADVQQVAVETDLDRVIYDPFIDGFALPESQLDRIARTA